MKKYKLIENNETVKECTNIEDIIEKVLEILADDVDFHAYNLVEMADFLDECLECNDYFQVKTLHKKIEEEDLAEIEYWLYGTNNFTILPICTYYNSEQLFNALNHFFKLEDINLRIEEE